MRGVKKETRFLAENGFLNLMLKREIVQDQSANSRRQDAKIVSRNQ
jgi:hypothetical protein